MVRLLKAFFFKISKDITFRITLIIGAGMAVFMTLLYLGLQLALGDEMGGTMLSGQSMLISSFSPAQNFGIAIPINVISFIVLEFTQGTIRNKIIAGHSKFKIYASLYLSGLVFAFALLLVYVGLCTALGSIFGGFNPNGFAAIGTSIGGVVSGQFIVRFVILSLLTYVSIVSFTVFFATLVRAMGPSLPVIILGIMGCYMVAMIFSVVVMTIEGEASTSFMTMELGKLAEAKKADGWSDEEIAKLSFKDVATPTHAQLLEFDKTLVTLDNVKNVLKVVDPLYAVAAVDTNDAGIATIDNYTFITGICSNLVYAAVFFFGGAAIFKKRDIK